MASLAKKSKIRTIGTIHTSTTHPEPKVIVPVFGNYVTQNRGFVEYLRGVRDQIDTYFSKNVVGRPLNILLAAPPGTGKSFLIKQIIASIESRVQVSFEEVYIASLEHSTELFSIFQRIQSINLEGKMPVIFFDEIDAKISGSHLYAKFLAPMWEGTFYLGKEKFFLGKCIFFFAGSTLSLEKESKAILKKQPARKKFLSYDAYFESWNEAFIRYIKKQTDKLPDFMDRVDAVIAIPPIRREAFGISLKKEYEDLACMLILKHFPEVKFIGKVALKVISDNLDDALIKGQSIRTVEEAIFNSRIQDQDTFDLSCFPKRFRDSNISMLHALIDGREKAVWEITREKSPLKPPTRVIR